MILPSLGKTLMAVLPIKKIRNPKKSKISEKVAPLGPVQLRISLRFFVHLSAAFISSVPGLAEKIVHGFCYRIPADAIWTQPLVEKIHYTAQGLRAIPEAALESSV
jgi:hypothetical protein